MTKFKMYFHQDITSKKILTSDFKYDAEFLLKLQAVPIGEREFEHDVEPIELDKAAALEALEQTAKAIRRRELLKELEDIGE